MKGRFTPYLLNAPAMGWMVIFFLVPLVSIISISLMTGNQITGYDLTWNLSIFPDAFGRYSDQIARSFFYGVLSTGIALVVMYPVAYWIAFHGGRRNALFLFLLLLPFLVSFIIRILAWQFILSDDGMVLGTLKHLGLAGETAHILSTPGAVIFGLTYDALPWMALPIYVGLEKIDRAQVEAASDLYATGWQQFRRVILPLSAPGVYAGILLVGITNIGDYLSAMLLGGPSTTMIGNIIETQYVQNGAFPVASALALILMVLLLLCVFLYAWVFGVRTLQEYA